MTENQQKAIEKRAQTALNLYAEGYNCSQSVFMAFADLYNIDQETAARFATSFGRGMGQLGEVCGAVSGMFMTLSQHYPATDVKDRVAKKTNFEAVRRTAAEFQSEMGSYICSDILKKHVEKENPSERYARYQSLRACCRCIGIASEIVGEEICKEPEV